jgi:hypothetical protein
VFEIVTEPEATAAPNEVPSLGVTRQNTASPREKEAPVRVVLVGAMRLPPTYQAVV